MLYMSSKYENMLVKWENNFTKIMQKYQEKIRKQQSNVLHFDIPATHLTKTITQV